MGSPEPRRKRKRTRRGHAKFSRKDFPLPCLSTILCICMICAVSIRKALQTRLVGQPSDRANSESLAMLLQNQHEINLKAAYFADLNGCLSLEPSESLGTFTCVADTPLLVRTMGNILNSETLLLVDIGSSTPSDFSASQEFGGDFESQSKAYVIEGQLSLPTSKVADIVLVEVKDDRPADVFSKLLVKCFQATEEVGVVIVFSRRRLGWGHHCEGKGCREGGLERGDSMDKGSSNLRKAVHSLACDSDGTMFAAVGNFDGGVVVLSQTPSRSSGPGVGCSELGDQDDPSPAALRPLPFEEIILRFAPDMGSIEEVQLEFGGSDAVRDSVRRRSKRSMCFSKPERTRQDDAAEEATRSTTVHGGLRSKRHHHHTARSTETTKDDAWPCLEGHLRAYPDDIRAVFALEMMIHSGQGGNRARRRATMLRDRALAESGHAGTVLWNKLYSRAAMAAANPLAE